MIDPAGCGANIRQELSSGREVRKEEGAARIQTFVRTKSWKNVGDRKVTDTPCERSPLLSRWDVTEDAT